MVAVLPSRCPGVKDVERSAVFDVIEDIKINKEKETKRCGQHRRAVMNDKKLFSVSLSSVPTPTVVSALQ